MAIGPDLALPVQRQKYSQCHSGGSGGPGTGAAGWSSVAFSAITGVG
jgi:hypothetical protein